MLSPGFVYHHLPVLLYLCSSHMPRAPFHSWTLTHPRGFGAPTTAQQTSWIQHLNFTAWILSELDQEAAGEAAAVLNSLSLACFTAEIKHPCVMAQWFLAQSSMRCVSIHWNRQRSFPSWWGETFCSTKAKPGKDKAKQKVSFLANGLSSQSSPTWHLPPWNASPCLWNGLRACPGGQWGPQLWGYWALGALLGDYPQLPHSNISRTKTYK